MAVEKASTFVDTFPQPGHVQQTVQRECLQPAVIHEKRAGSTWNFVRASARDATISLHFEEYTRAWIVLRQPLSTKC
jgi:hypothetical protein